MWQEFKKFALRGNVIDMAIGIIIGTAFSKIISSLVKDILMPPVGFFLGGTDFSNLALTVGHNRTTNNTVTINYGLFFNTVLDFFIIALIIFFIVKAINRAMPPKPVVSPIKCPLCLMEVPKGAHRCCHCTGEIKG